MSAILISDELRDQILSAEGPVELVDRNGRAIGRTVKYVQLCGHVVADDFPTDADIDRDLAAGRYKTAEQTAEWFAALKSGATPCS